MKSQQKPKNKKGNQDRDSIFSPEHEKRIYNDMLEGKGSKNFKTGKINGPGTWDESFIIDVGDGDKIRVWEKSGKLTYPTADERFGKNEFYKKKFAKALKNYKKPTRYDLEKLETPGKEIYRRKGSSFTGDL